jgi:hypothetical protein
MSPAAGSRRPLPRPGGRRRIGVTKLDAHRGQRLAVDGVERFEHPVYVIEICAAPSTHARPSQRAAARE